uniref:CCT-eta n=1 Tax=Aureoumbra lagunensis TaxID=44058 RepID=A0A7S3NK56_9STRA|mmetsp:Transcript_17577/g.22927  ORF Transcript_17577/g.22927 Transcript_17577/m.22927 type:complete len:601 (-) Transcript_17577:63-1865(-)|eukprot:CAMPEP_0197292622 /NCGR_PEP_ID=MMETSP0890-20130614/24310_1 /TAXON_ID=44058 ORGANISM="Aureoumbra lagunensis, Strain CCMP1510" /NCGR_SAMPLE_ID=MMETSP0890 /ASSEMBLY_ACC=CAM_ASM_000533 /LENGTH=600 /DNA_ID=CAMNT_0042766689 /DNA_START=27 /DNA_END=1829 /DNA_ORIENTATION=-
MAMQPPMRLPNGQIQPGIILLREGTDTSQGKAQLISNINACAAVAEAIRSTLGPRGMDKLLFDGQKVTISNDGATIMKLLDIVHPAAKVLSEISTSQDAEVGDGTTSVVLLGSEILQQVKPLIEDGLHPTIIIKGIRKAATYALKRLSEICVEPDIERRKRLAILASTALNSKLIANYKSLFAPMVVDAVLAVENETTGYLDLQMVGVKKVPGGSVSDSFFVQGVAFKKTFSYAGFEQMTKLFQGDVQLLLLNIELELKSEKDNAEIQITDPDDYQKIVDAEWTIIYEKLDACVQCGAHVILSKLPIGDLATQYFADRGLFCAGRVPEDDLDRVAKATGGVVQTSLLDLSQRTNVLGHCGHFEEKQLGGERYNVFTDCPKAKTATIVLRGGSEQFIEESHRSIHDALMIAKRAAEVGIKNHNDAVVGAVVGGGGAIEMALSKSLRDQALSIAGKDQLILLAFAKALEIIPRQLATNSGFDSTDVLNALRQKHAKASTTGPLQTWFGVDCSQPGIVDTLQAEIWEPAANKANALAAAAEAAVVVLSVDETVTNPKSEQPGAADKSGVSLAEQQRRTAAMAQGGGMQSLMGRHGGKGVRRLK